MILNIFVLEFAIMDTSIFSHFLITRFNIPNKGWQHDKNNNQVQNQEWLLHRIALFETYCLPSIQNQTNKDFTWLVYFNADSPELLTKKIAEWKQICSNFVPQYSNDYDAFLEYQMSDVILKNVSNKTEFVITTRLDNDDALHTHAIEQIQLHVIPQHNTIIDIEHGYCFNTSDARITKQRFVSNAFISYIESAKTESLKTVYGEGHPAWIGKANFISITHQYLWLQIIHEKNVINYQKGRVVVFPRALHPFGVYLTKSYIIQACFTGSKQWYYELKHWIKTVLKKIFI